MRERLKCWYVFGGTSVVLVFLVYVLLAPAVFKSAAQQGAHFPAAYVPLLRVAASDFGGPLRWYSKVCGAELEFFNEPTTPTYVIVVYGLGALVVFAGLWRLIQRRHSRAGLHDA